MLEYREKIFSIEYAIADIDNNGHLDKHDFECMALRMTLIEGKGDFNYNRYQENLHIMLSLWEEIADLADFDKVHYNTHCFREQNIFLSWHDLNLALVSRFPEFFGLSSDSCNSISSTVIIVISLTFKAIYSLRQFTAIAISSSRNAVLVS